MENAMSDNNENLKTVESENDNIENTDGNTDDVSVDIEKTDEDDNNETSKAGKSKMHSYDAAFKLLAVDFAKSNSKEAAARKFKVDPKRIRE